MRPTSHSYKILRALENGPATCREIADETGIAVHVATTRVCELCRMNAVERSGKVDSVKGDRRRSWLFQLKG